MATMTRITPIIKSVRVRANAERAFEVFTARIGKWWPSSHTIGKSPMKQVVVEPRQGGRWYEIGEDGSECLWGDVLAWNPPGRLLLAWRIGGDWTFNPDLLTEIEVTFKAVGNGETEVRLEHRKLENLGAAAEQAAGIFDSASGWSGSLARYAEAVHAE